MRQHVSITARLAANFGLKAYGRVANQEGAVCRQEPGEQSAQGLQRSCRKGGRSHRLLKVLGIPLRLFSSLFRCCLVKRCCIFHMRDYAQARL